MGARVIMSGERQLHRLKWVMQVVPNWSGQRKRLAVVGSSKSFLAASDKDFLGFTHWYVVRRSWRRKVDIAVGRHLLAVPHVACPAT